MRCEMILLYVTTDFSKIIHLNESIIKKKQHHKKPFFVQFIEHSLGLQKKMVTQRHAQKDAIVVNNKDSHWRFLFFCDR